MRGFKTNSVIDSKVRWVEGALAVGGGATVCYNCLEGGVARGTAFSGADQLAVHTSPVVLHSYKYQQQHSSWEPSADTAATGYNRFRAPLLMRFFNNLHLLSNISKEAIYSCNQIVKWVVGSWVMSQTDSGKIRLFDTVCMYASYTNIFNCPCNSLRCMPPLTCVSCICLFSSASRKQHNWLSEAVGRAEVCTRSMHGCFLDKTIMIFACK